VGEALAVQNFSSFVASNGVDGNPCTRTQPCQTLQRAHDQTEPNGKVGIVDVGDYGPLTITKSISIVSEVAADTLGVGGGSINSPNITISAGPQDVITLRGLTLDGAGNGSAGAIRFTSGGKLYIHNCIITNWSVGSGIGGVLFAPSGPSYLVITDTIFSQNTDGSSGSGVLVKPQVPARRARTSNVWWPQETHLALWQTAPAALPEST
jgi:hypothetical protein